MKYKLTDETIEFEGRTLHRIQAITNFGDVKEGDLGGWIEHEGNLSHFNSAWVYEEAKVYDDAKVYCNAKVWDNAIVKGDSHVYDAARVIGNTIIEDNTSIGENATVGGNSIIGGNSTIIGNQSIMNKEYKDIVINKYVHMLIDDGNVITQTPEGDVMEYRIYQGER